MWTIAHGVDIGDSLLTSGDWEISFLKVRAERWGDRVIGGSDPVNSGL